MKKLQIDEKEALRLYPIASKEFKIILESTFTKEFFNRDITEKVNDINSLLEFLDLEENELFLFDINTKDKEKKYLNACKILPKIAEIYNEGKVLDWKNTSEYKYFPYLNFSNGGGSSVLFYGWSYRLYCPVGFYYVTDNLQQKAYKNFKKYFEDYWGYNS